MKSIIIVLKQVVSPMVLFLFTLLGLIAATLSGVIEYQVIKQMFAVNIGNANFKFFVPLVIVVVLEGFKLFLHYAIPAHKRINDSESMKIKEFARIVLVLFSLVCTFIFTCNSMYSFDDVSEAIAQEKQTIIDKYNNEVDKIDAQIKSDKEEMLKPLESALDSYENQIDEVTNKIIGLNPSYSTYEERYEDLKSHKDELETERDTKIGEYQKYIMSVESELRNNYAKRLEQLEKQKNDDIAKLINTHYSDTSGDNEYIRAMLMFMKTTFRRNAEKAEYSRALYFIIVSGIALLISIILEMVISTTQAYLSKQSDVLVEIFGSKEGINSTIKQHSKRIIYMFMQASIMLSVFLILGLFDEVILNDSKFSLMSGKNLAVAFGSYLVSVLFTSGSRKIKTVEYNGSKAFIKGAAVTTGFIVPIVVQTLLCIVGFVVLGFVFKNNNANVLPSTMALTIGSVGGQLIFTPVKNT